jgi:cytochrome b involved in lipid metabolism
MAVTRDTMNQQEHQKVYTWHEIKNRENINETIWIVINGYVYDVTKFSKRHPGGPRILKSVVNQDATVCKL